MKSPTLAIEHPVMRHTVPVLGVAALTLVLVYVLLGREIPFLTAGLAGLACLVFFRNPHWGVLAIMGFWLCRFSPVLLGSRHLRLTHIVAALLLVPLGLRLLRDRDVWIWRAPQVRYLLGVGVIFLLSTVWAGYKYPVTYFAELDMTASFSQEFITHFLFFVYFLYFIDTRRKLTLAMWLVVAFIVVSVASAYATLFSVPGWRRANASFGIGTNPTSFPFLSLFGASLLWGYYTAGWSTRWKGWVMPLLIALPVMALASGSRTGLLQLITLGILLFVDRSGGWSKSKRLRGLLLLVCVIVLASLLVPTIAVLRSTSFETTSTAPGGVSLTNRLQTVGAGLAMAASDPILGIGLGNFLWMHTAHYGLKKLPHNSYLWALAEGGVGALVLYLLLLYATYRMLRQLEAAGPSDMLWIAKGLRFGLTLLVVFSLTDDTWMSDLFYVLVAATVALYRLAQTSRPVHVPQAAGALR